MPNPEVIPPGADDAVNVVSVNSDALAILNRSEIEQQVEIARKYPRSIDKFRQQLDKYANLNQDVALSMFYSLKRRKADGTEAAIVGPSVRFAEALVPCWTNSRAGVRILGEQGNVTAAQGVFFDCETNTGVSVESNRSIVGKGNKRFSQDMIVTTGNAAASIAYRNAIIRGVPRALWLDIYEKAKQTAVGKAESFAGQVTKAVEEFAKQGVTQVALLNTLGAISIRDIGADHILTMRTLFREIRDGEKTIEEVFGSVADEEITAIMVELGWNATTQRMSMESYKGRRDAHLEYLRDLAKKAGRATKGPQAVKGKAAESATEGDTTASKDTAEAANVTDAKTTAAETTTSTSGSDAKAKAKLADEDF